jgi:hypothetical protein
MLGIMLLRLFVVNTVTALCFCCVFVVGVMGITIITATEEPTHTGFLLLGIIIIACNPMVNLMETRTEKQYVLWGFTVTMAHLALVVILIYYYYNNNYKYTLLISTTTLFYFAMYFNSILVYIDLVAVFMLTSFTAATFKLYAEF